MKLYIDNLVDTDEFAFKIIKRLNSIGKEKLSVYNFEMLSDGQSIPNSQVAERLLDFDIIITIVNNDYLAEIKGDINEVLDELVEDDKKYIIPIIYTPTNWSSKKWIVSSKVFPKDDKSISELNNIELEKTLNTLIQTIENIIVQDTKQISNSKISNENKEGGLIFISHCHDDADFAELLKLQLEKENINCWIDNEKLKVGQEWRNEIDEGIENSNAIIVIMTPEARKSEYVTYEWAFAWGKNKKVFPIMLKQTTLHPRLESLQYLDFTNRLTRPWENLIKSLKEIH